MRIGSLRIGISLTRVLGHDLRAHLIRIYHIGVWRALWFALLSSLL
jgi:hypothetical protein